MTNSQKLQIQHVITNSLRSKFQNYNPKEDELLYYQVLKILYSTA